MAGHSKFKNIMHRKGAQDAKRAKVFSRMSREITVAAKSGLPDPAMNPRLRAAILAARAENMPKDRIENAVKKGSGELGGEDYLEIRYEGYGAGGVAIVVEALTDNRNRTAADVRAAFNKYGGTLGESGSVSFMFDQVGLITYPATIASEDAMMEAAIEAGAEDCQSDEDGHEVTTAIGDLHAVLETLATKFGDPSKAKLVWRPQNMTPVSGDKAQSLMKMLEALDELDDVQEVYGNYEFDEAELERLSA